MATYFFDTSGIVKRYVQEIGTPWVQAVTDPATANTLYLSRISMLEVTSAVVRRQRGAGLSASLASSVLAQFRQDCVLEYRIVEINPTLIADAMRLAESHALRANDALQLAVVDQLHTLRTNNGLSPITLVSSDLELNTAARILGILVEDPNLHP